MPLRYLGSRDPDLILYLPNQPIIPTPDQPLDVTLLIAINGNHWRKIFSILAKLSTADGDWRSYRDNALLHRKEAICFDDRLIASSARHLVAGKASWMRLGLDQDDFHSLDDRQRVWKRDNVFLIPYPDYRQFPNALIEQTKLFLNPGLPPNSAMLLPSSCGKCSKPVGKEARLALLQQRDR